MKTSEQTDKILPALFNVKKELGAVTKGANNPFFGSRYADLNTHLDAVEPLLEKYGCLLLQPMSENNVVESLVVHVESGQFVSSTMGLVLLKNTMQEVGSAVTYARRYTLGSLLSMKAVDDDSELAMGRQAQYKTSAPKKETAPLSLAPVAPPSSTAANEVAVAPTAVTQLSSTTVTPLKRSGFRKSLKTETNVTPLQVVQNNTTISNGSTTITPDEWA